MSGYDDLARALAASAQATSNERGERAWLQVHPDSKSIAVAGQPNMVWVRTELGRERGLSQAFNAFGARLIADLPVRVERQNGVLCVIGYDTQTVLSAYAGESFAGSALSQGAVDPVEDRRIAPGLVHAYKDPTTGYGMAVAIEAFTYVYGGVGKRWPGGTIDLTAYAPSGVVNVAWVKVGIDPATNTAVAAKGTEKPKLVGVPAALLDEIDFADYIPLAGVKLYYDTDAIDDEAVFLSCRPWWSGGTGASLDDLSDVDTSTTSPEDGQALVWDDANSKWVPGSVAAGGGSYVQPLTAKVIPTSNQTIPGNSTETPVTFSTVVFDTSSFWTASYPTRLTVPQDGYYFVRGSLRYNTSGGNGTHRLAILKVDGSSIIARINGNDSEGYPECEVTSLVYLTEGQYVELIALQDSGSNIALLSSGGFTYWVSLSIALIAYVSAPEAFRYVLQPNACVASATLTAWSFGTHGWSMTALAYAPSTEETAFWTIPLPSTLPASFTATLTLHWSTAGSSGAVVWQATSLSRANGETLDAAGTNDTFSADTVLAALDEHVCGKALTTAGWAAGELLLVRITRKATDAGDTLAGDAYLLNAILEIEA